MNFRHKIYLITSMIAFISLTGCGIVGGSTPPDLTLIVEGEAFTAAQGSYCWGSLCADAVYPPVIESFVTLSAGGQITLGFDKPAPDSAFVGLDLYDTFPDAESAASMRFETVPNTITWIPKVPAGDYILLISAQWEQGNDATYHIGVTVP
jgi:hypothetical protein